jgi:hypothetical protein
VTFTVTARQSAHDAGASTASKTTDSQTNTAGSLFLVIYRVAIDDVGGGADPLLTTPTGGSLAYTLIAKDGEGDNWGYVGGGYEMAIGAWRSTIGASPSSFAVTVDGAPGGGPNGFHSCHCVDVTSYDTGTPIRQSAVNGAAGTNPAGEDNLSATVTLPSAPRAGNLIISTFGCTTGSADPITAPTAGGGKTMTNLFGTAGARTDYRICDGTESATITTTDLGTGVVSWCAVALEVNTFVAPAGLNINQAVKTAAYF